MNSIKPISIKRKIRIIWDIILIHIIFRTPSFSKPNFNNTLLEASFSRNTIAQSALNESYGNRMI